MRIGGEGFINRGGLVGLNKKGKSNPKGRNHRNGILGNRRTMSDHKRIESRNTVEIRIEKGQPSFEERSGQNLG